MRDYTVRLEDETIGRITTITWRNPEEYIGEEVTILLHDENGNTFTKKGVLAEVLEYTTYCLATSINTSQEKTK